MKVKKLEGYEPEYPKKKNAVMLGAVAAAALITIGSSGCRPQLGGAPMADPTELPGTEFTGEPTLEGDVKIDVTFVPEFPDTTSVVSVDPDLPDTTGVIAVDPDATDSGDNGQ